MVGCKRWRLRARDGPGGVGLRGHRNGLKKCPTLREFNQAEDIKTPPNATVNMDKNDNPGLFHLLKSRHQRISKGKKQKLLF